MKNIISKWLFAAVLTLVTTSLWAFDGVRLASGTGSESSDVYKLSILKDSDRTYLDDWVHVYWEFGCNVWNHGDPFRDDVKGVSFAPVLVHDFDVTFWTGRPFIEYSLGLIYLTETRINNTSLGMHWQFDNRLSLGINIGKGTTHTFGISYQHVSNAGLDSDNSGFDSNELFYSYHF